MVDQRFYLIFDLALRDDLTEWVSILCADLPWSANLLISWFADQLTYWIWQISNFYLILLLDLVRWPYWMSKYPICRLDMISWFSDELNLLISWFLCMIIMIMIIVIIILIYFFFEFATFDNFVNLFHFLKIVEF